MTESSPTTTAAAEHEGPTDFDEPDTGAVRHLRKAFGPGPANGESYVASAEDIARCLAANPQLRAAVLDALGHREEWPAPPPGESLHKATLELLELANGHHGRRIRAR